MRFTLRAFLGFFVLLWYLNAAQAQISDAAAIGLVVQKQFSTGKIFINKILLEEPHIIPQEALVKFFAKYEGREVGVEEIKEVQKRLSRYYYTEGYINSGVIVPNQRIVDGVIRFRAVHGRLTRVKVTGNSRISSAYIRNAIAKGVSVPLHTGKLQFALESLQKHPLISEVKAQVSPGERLGQSILTLSIKEANPSFFNAQLSNHQSPSIGQYRLGVGFGHRDITGNRDVLKINLAASVDESSTLGLVSGNLDYTLPVTVEDYLLNTSVNYGKFAIVDDEFSAAEIKSESTSIGFSLSAPLVRAAHFELTAGIGLDVKHMTLSMFGEPATLSDGFVDGESNSTPLTFHLNALYQRARFVTAMYAGLRRGTNINLYGGNNEGRIFTIAVGQLSMATKLLPKLEWHFRINGQLTRDNLLPAEKYAIGGAKSVRGYRENLLVRDNGIAVSNQLRYALFRSILHFVPFFDYGRSWDSEQGKFGSTGEQIYSAGAGLQWKANKAFYSELFWGKTLVNIASNTDQTQDYSLHFLMRYTYN
ncbi:MAG TPA: ShlB/FhaC/HecB family hemolysin secretion/activation protein [Gammaproteobacteria bacterium]|nr:ShlB/FhaC/HecB family hemolysin secretion/activation protein [Gammaproteobacteria bacterium]